MLKARWKDGKRGGRCNSDIWRSGVIEEHADGRVKWKCRDYGGRSKIIGGDGDGEENGRYGMTSSIDNYFRFLFCALSKTEFLYRKNTYE